MRFIRGLRIDWNNAEGEVVLPDEFEEMDALFRADVLKDWVFLLEEKYNEAVGGIFDDLPFGRQEAGLSGDPPDNTKDQPTE